MLTQHGRICGAGYLVSDDIDEGGQPYVECTDTIDDWSGLLPDLTDPATVGCLLALVREAWGRDGIHARKMGDDIWGVYLDPWLKRRPIAVAGSQADALVAALEAAP
jgi:hypothetical protein